MIDQGSLRDGLVNIEVDHFYLLINLPRIIKLPSAAPQNANANFKVVSTKPILNSETTHVFQDLPSMIC